jgi:hypothetical protein
MENLKICLDVIELACVPVGSISMDDLARDVVWRGEGIEILASVCNETLSLQILCERESVLVFAGKVTGPVTFECKVAEGRKLTLNLH